MKHPGHTYGGFVPAISERGMTRPQNHVVFGLSVAPQNRRREVCAGHVSRSSGLLGMKASPDRIFQSDLKTGGGAMMGGARGTIVEVASEAS